ncbi:hypothetical protein CFC21_070886 [Triticum aestivum]|uniref:Mitochondrial glycoprotein n=3 Tax=Triticum TaxID=4564 RepID=A0A9R1HGF2_WHEAT|nr:uncharacterized protein LOC123111252 [Triticum aestivum]KAF7064610.1 hypothetical protein CFC21_070885 [Triticum aestivum]KAF7064613.1 hypothetical protein CFC21_070886 [Triticum aestivum]VAI29964.1 unnamed protein product [Triticum turgidum subsp. durum]
MFLRRLSTSASGVLRRRRRGAKDDGVLAALRAEIAHELSSPPSSSPSSLHSQEALGFATVSDAPRAQDVLLRRRGDAEEVHVSALLAPLRFEGEEPLPRDALMKVFVSKPGVEPLLRFDCRAVAAAGGAAAGYDITALSYHAFPGDGGDSKYEGPDFGDLDPKLQTALKEYLLARGVTPELATSLREHLLQKEQVQYVSWLKTLEGMFTKDH